MHCLEFARDKERLSDYIETILKDLGYVILQVAHAHLSVGKSKDGTFFMSANVSYNSEGPYILRFYADISIVLYSFTLENIIIDRYKKDLMIKAETLYEFKEKHFGKHTE